jgi:hypothetical protein
MIYVSQYDDRLSARYLCFLSFLHYTVHATEPKMTTVSIRLRDSQFVMATTPAI